MQSDAATRRQDQGFFESWYRLEGFPDLTVAARLMRNPLGGPQASWEEYTYGVLGVA